MPCLHPVPAYQVGIGTKLVFRKPEEAHKELTVPCNWCINCLTKNSVSWMVRQHCEAATVDKHHLINLFVTLTYELEKRPDHDHIRYEDVKAFWKRLRSRLDYESGKNGRKADKFKYVCVPEYGDLRGHPHYHANIFGIYVPDLKSYGRNDEGNNVYKSEIIEQSWSHGIVDIQAFGTGSARYIANHNIKQNGESVKNKLKQFHYKKLELLKEAQKTETPCDPVTGLILPENIPLPQPYASNGIGLQYFNRYNKEIYSNDFVTINGTKFGVPRYFDDKLLEIDPKRWMEVRTKRQNNAKEYTEKQLKAIEFEKLHKRQFFAKKGKL